MRSTAARPAARTAPPSAPCYERNCGDKTNTSTRHQRLASGAQRAAARPVVTHHSFILRMFARSERGRAKMRSLLNAAVLAVRLPFRASLFGARSLRARALVPALFVACAIFFAALWAPITFLLYALHRRRPLSAAEKLALGPRRRFKDVFVVEKPHWAMRLFFGGAAACAIDGGIYVFADSRERTGLSIGLLRHECVHIVQYVEEGGFVPFLAAYFAFTLYDLAASRCDGRAAYRENPFEVDARKREKKDAFAKRVAEHELQCQ